MLSSPVSAIDSTTPRSSRTHHMRADQFHDITKRHLCAHWSACVVLLAWLHRGKQHFDFESRRSFTIDIVTQGGCDNHTHACLSTHTHDETPASAANIIWSSRIMAPASVFWWVRRVSTFRAAETMRAISFLGAGTQPWSSSVCTVHKDRFAYASTLAVNVYQVLILRFLKTVLANADFFFKAIFCICFQITKGVI